MAEGLSAVATKASPRPVAKASWSGRRIPRPKTSVGDDTARQNNKTLFIFIVCGLFVQGMHYIARNPALHKQKPTQDRPVSGGLTGLSSDGRRFFRP